jgi:hypothetical protein
VWTGNTRHTNSALFTSPVPNIGSRGSSVGTATDYGLDGGRFDSRQRKNFFLFSATRLWGPATLLSDGCRGLCTSTLTCRHSVVINYLSTGTTLPTNSTVPVFFSTLLKIAERRAMGWTSGFRVPAEVTFSLLHGVHTGSGAHPALYLIGLGGSSPRGKAAGV